MIFSVCIDLRQMTNLKRGGWLHEKESDDRHLRFAGNRSSGTDPHAPEDEYLEGMIVRIFGMEVYNSVE